MRRALILAALAMAAIAVIGFTTGAGLKATVREFAQGKPALQTRTTAAALKAAALHLSPNPATGPGPQQETNQQSQATPMQQQGTIAGQVHTAAVTVVVRNHAGAPVANADVQIHPPGFDFLTDEHGRALFYLSPGKFGFWVNANGFEPAYAYIILRDTKPHAVNVVVKPAPETNQQTQATPMQQAGQRGEGATTQSGGRQNAGATLQNDGGQAPFDSAQDKPARQTRARSAALKTAALHLSPNLPAQQQSQATLVPNGAPMPPRKVAITFDDLPAFSSNALNGTQIDAQNAKLLGTLRREKIPAIGFVNEVKLYKWGEVDERIKALQMWLDDGFELGNHTYSHVSLNKVGLQAWEENVIEGEPVLKLLLAQHHMTLRYLRHPFLDTGADLLTRREAEAFLSSRGYRVAPVTIDVGDWEFAPVYFAAKRKGDTADENRIVAAFLDYANQSLDYAEKFSKQIIGYEPMQVILLHDSQLEADHFADLAAVMRKRNYSFITLDEALGDSAYNLPNDYAGGGTSWLDQWAITEGKMPPNEPALPDWIAKRLASLH